MSPRIALVALLLACNLGCHREPVQAKQAPAPPIGPSRSVDTLGGGWIIESEESGGGGSTTTTTSGESVGAGASAVGEQLKAGVTGEASRVDLGDGAGSSGGGFDADFSALTSPSLFRSPFAWGGVLGIIAAAWFASKQLWRQAAMAFVGGVVLVFAAVQPWLLLVPVALIAFEYYRASKGHEVARTLVQAVNDAPQPARLAIKAEVDRVRDAAGKPGERDWLRAIKLADGVSLKESEKAKDA